MFTHVDESQSGKPGCLACSTGMVSNERPCREAFHELSVLECSDSGYGRMRFVSVDAFVLQHPKEKRPKLLAFHLLRLYWLLHIAGANESARPGPLASLVSGGLDELPVLEPPRSSGALTVADVGHAPTADEHCERVLGWAKSVWQSWSCHHSWVLEYFKSRS
ncbi:MAG: hypothetical protein HY814_01875 [Candidatus Riflebacteria bacterium]|nr:hypothetical protein [Candidatus Riflebacteria bacterium]